MVKFYCRKKVLKHIRLKLRVGTVCQVRLQALF